MSSQSITIQQLNDRFRAAIPSSCDVPGRVLITRAVQQLVDDDAEPGKYLPKIIKIVREFVDFNSYNDPHNEHDFGAFYFEGEKMFWKIDYYDPELQHRSESPADTAKTMRVLTIMLANEY